MITFERFILLGILISVIIGIFITSYISNANYEQLVEFEKKVDTVLLDTRELKSINLLDGLAYKSFKLVELQIEMDENTMENDSLKQKWKADWKKILDLKMQIDSLQLKIDK